MKVTLIGKIFCGEIGTSKISTASALTTVAIKVCTMLRLYGAYIWHRSLSEFVSCLNHVAGGPLIFKIWRLFVMLMTSTYKVGHWAIWNEPSDLIVNTINIHWLWLPEAWQRYSWLALFLSTSTAPADQKQLWHHCAFQIPVLSHLKIIYFSSPGDD